MLFTSIKMVIALITFEKSPQSSPNHSIFLTCFTTCLHSNEKKNERKRNTHNCVSSAKSIINFLISLRNDDKKVLENTFLTFPFLSCITIVDVRMNDKNTTRNNAKNTSDMTLRLNYFICVFNRVNIQLKIFFKVL